MRDDFTQSTKDLLANRVGWKCSNPDCRKATRGAGSDKTEFVNIGVASHICAASAGGPRYDKNMNSELRKSFDNGIWLCQSCSKLIDSDIKRYTKEKLCKWKTISEDLAILDLEAPNTLETKSDEAIIKFFAQCFDRSAFKDRIAQEGRMEDFDKAIEDTIIAINTGVLRTREGEILKISEGKSSIINQCSRDKMDVIVDMLEALRRRLKIAKAEKAYTTYGDFDVMYCFYDRDLEEWFDRTRDEILKIFASVCKDYGLREMHFRRREYRW